MNPDTKTALIGLCDAVTDLAAANLIHIGMETATKVVDAAYKAKMALQGEKTNSN